MLRKEKYDLSDGNSINICDCHLVANGQQASNLWQTIGIIA